MSILLIPGDSYFYSWLDFQGYEFNMFNPYLSPPPVSIGGDFAFSFCTGLQPRVCAWFLVGDFLYAGQPLPTSYFWIFQNVAWTGSGKCVFKKKVFFVAFRWTLEFRHC